MGAWLQAAPIARRPIQGGQAVGCFQSYVVDQDGTGPSAMVSGTGRRGDAACRCNRRVCAQWGRSETRSET